MSDLSLHAIPGTSLHDALRRDGWGATSPPASRTVSSQHGPHVVTLTWYASGETEANVSDDNGNLLARFHLSPGAAPAVIERLARAAERIATDDEVAELVVRSADAGLWCRRDTEFNLAELAAYRAAARRVNVSNN